MADSRRVWLCGADKTIYEQLNLDERCNLAILLLIKSIFDTCLVARMKKFKCLKAQIYGVLTSTFLGQAEDMKIELRFTKVI